MPDVIQVITGRFERNPPLYYQMRLARVTRELQHNPKRLADYDDAGVACDRLGHDDLALAWMEQKRQQLVKSPLDDPLIKDHWYRLYANRGTFQTHHWLQTGANRHRMAELKAARNDIAHALQINPDAHFGREKYQLQVLNWIIYPANAPNEKEINNQSWTELQGGIIGHTSYSKASVRIKSGQQSDQISAYNDAAREQLSEYAGSDFASILLRKKSALMRLDPRRKTQREQWYSCYVNLGTYLAMQASQTKIPSQRAAQLVSAHANLAEAIRFMPHHDSGVAERQMKIVEGMLRSATADFDPRWNNAIPLKDFLGVAEGDNKARISGLCGLIVLGNAWQSVDMFSALSKTIWTATWKQNISYLADLRCAELINQSRGSLMPGAPKGNALKEQLELFSQQVHQEDLLKSLYPKLRAEAESWQKTRTNYMMARLTKGRHPDTDPTFWNDYHSTPSPSLEMASYLTPQQALKRDISWGMNILLIGIGLLCFVSLAKFIRQRTSHV